MSRLIKFRAWTGREMFYQGKQYLASFVRRAVPKIIVDHDGKEYREHESYLPNGGDIGEYLMQFTGLLDKNGKDIYEGDIVRINHPHDLTGDFTNALGEVYWWEEEGGWYHGNGNGRPPKRMWKYVEVVGNVYETPELLPS